MSLDASIGKPRQGARVTVNPDPQHPGARSLLRKGPAADQPKGERLRPRGRAGQPLGEFRNNRLGHLAAEHEGEMPLFRRHPTQTFVTQTDGRVEPGYLGDWRVDRNEQTHVR